MKAIRKVALLVLPAGLVFSLLASADGLRGSTSDARPLAADAAATYGRYCVSCHGRDGGGRTRKGRRTHARDLTEGSWQDDVSDERLFNSIHNGRGKMPAFRKSLSENEIDTLVAYVRRFRR